MSAPDKTPATETPAHQLGATLRTRRKALGISTTAAAEAAQISRITWHRLEKGEDSVALRSFLAAARVLGLQPSLAEAAATAADPGPHLPLQAWLPLHIPLQDYPQLRSLAWQVSDGAHTLSPREALGLYERNWRHLAIDQLQANEHALIAALRQTFGPQALPDV